jgi:hypothetical protein
MDDTTRPQKRSWDRPDGTSFDDWMKSRVARVSDRPYDSIRNIAGRRSALSVRVARALLRIPT